MIGQMNNMARKLAWSFAKTNNDSYEDLYSEAQVALLEAVPKYDPERSAWSTFAYRAISNRLCDAVRKWRTDRGWTPKDWNLEQDPLVAGQISRDLMESRRENPLMERPHLEPQSYRLAELKSSLSILSAEAKDVLRIVAQAPGELLAMGQRETPTRLRQGLKRTLRERGWPEDRIRKAFEEIKKAL